MQAPLAALSPHVEAAHCPSVYFQAVEKSKGFLAAFSFFQLKTSMVWLLVICFSPLF